MGMFYTRKYQVVELIGGIELGLIEKIMTLIANSGDARSKAMEAIKVSKENDFENANSLLEVASTELINAHRVQTQLIQEEAAGNKQDITLLMIHAQDHLMNSMTVKELAVELVSLHKRIHTIEIEKGNVG
ncbi:PTS system cellobiose-specific IIA component [Aureibacillus halotolerans]|uniref:PTS system cellobiose-specific IIA component n=2 Tax=Aureibacillus halotolerans TaxID=1508390 RepID=A0A4R6TV91_9BACI|nr:PTS system cellobiose-specific IIA component [Aureibacillus halotolerans]